MMINKENLKSYAPVFLRIGLAIVFIVFGIDQLFFNPEVWASYFPSFFPANAVFFNGIFDLILGLWLLSGIYVRISGLLASLHLLGVVAVLSWMTGGYNEIAVRDFGLLMAAIAVFLNGADRLSPKNLQI
jgi:uncharacterized membrane protein YphA (DoxX/SURF4 family)